ncbi:MAG: hypothetical protein VKK04_23435 [Synechococcales bacterium]|nr:hypothetical protein [Synechococcales bacterium]
MSRFRRLRYRRRPNRPGRYLRGSAVIASLLILTLSFPGFWLKLEDSGWLSRVLSTQPASAQRTNTIEIAERVYGLMPNLPLENHYESRATGDVAVSNTLASRLIRYHLYVKGRSPLYRFDWKLTLADYLGANEWIEASLYPGADDLEENPQAGDVAAIGNLNRAQRDQLVGILVDLHGGNSGTSPYDR